MKELLEGRALGFAPRPALGFLALGLAIAVTVADLMAYFAWGARETGGYTVVAYWLTIATAIVALLAMLTAIAEHLDVLEEERGLARLDLAAAVVVFLVYAASAALRSTQPGAAAPTPAPFLIAVAGLIVLFVDGIIAANLFSAREWEEPEEEPYRERHTRRRAATH